MSTILFLNILGLLLPVDVVIIIGKVLLDYVKIDFKFFNNICDKVSNTYQLLSLNHITTMFLICFLGISVRAKQQDMCEARESKTHRIFTTDLLMYFPNFRISSICGFVLKFFTYKINLVKH